MSYEAFAWWSNYHMTQTLPGAVSIDAGRVGMGDVPVGVAEMARIHLADAMELPPLERLAAAAGTLQAHLAHLAARYAAPDYVPGLPYSPGTLYPVGMVGSGWSFSPLLGEPHSQLRCEGLAHVGALPEGHASPHAVIDPGRIAIAGGGTRMRELVNWAESRGLSIATSGSFLGTTLAGGAATASHGSRLGFGGIQNLIVGLHIVTAADRHWWIEREDSPILSDAGLGSLAVSGSTLEIIRNNQVFDAVLVHLGALGIVNGVAIELAPLERFAVFRRDLPIDADWLEQAAKGDFAGIASRLGVESEPAFYELTINPNDPFGPHALHTLYIEQQHVPLAAPQAGFIITGHGEPILLGADAVASIASALLHSIGHEPLESLALKLAANPGADPMAQLIRVLLRSYDSAFDYYRSMGFSSGGSLSPPMTWGELHGRDELTGGIPGALYNASFAIDRADLPVAIPAICESVAQAGLPGSFIFTVRFVDKSAGALAFTRFDHSAVIEIDGLSPFICNKAASYPDRAGNTLRPDVVAGLHLLGQTLPRGTESIRDALDANKIAYAMHWGKLGLLDNITSAGDAAARAKILADFGDPSTDAKCRLARWRDARAHLLDDFGKAIFRSSALERLGIV